MSEIHIVFGSEGNRANYARAKAVNPRLVVLATQPSKIQPLMKESVDVIKVVRYPVEVWTPSTFPCEKRVKETEEIIQGYRRLGVTVVEVGE